jgi:protein-tyrosine phosphatase
MTTFRIPGPWPGPLSIVLRPRGGDWLVDEITAWQDSGIHTVVSLLTDDEATELDLAGEARVCRQHGIDLVAFPIPDRGVPESMATSARVLGGLRTTLDAGRHVAVHCRQGIGRSALVTASLLVLAGTAPDAAFATVAAARGARVPDTPEQREWVRQFARYLSGRRQPVQV